MLVSVITVNEWAYLFQLNFIKKSGRPNLGNLPTSVLDIKPLILWNLQSVEQTGMVLNKKIIGIMSEVCIV